MTEIQKKDSTYTTDIFKKVEERILKGVNDENDISDMNLIWNPESDEVSAREADIQTIMDLWVSSGSNILDIKDVNKTERKVLHNIAAHHGWQMETYRYVDYITGKKCHDSTKWNIAQETHNLGTIRISRKEYIDDIEWRLVSCEDVDNWMEKDKKKQSQKCGCEICKKYTQQEKDKEEIAKVREENDKLQGVINELRGNNNSQHKLLDLIEKLTRQNRELTIQNAKLGRENDKLWNRRKIHYSDRLPTENNFTLTELLVHLAEGLITDEEFLRLKNNSNKIISRNGISHDGEILIKIDKN